MFSNVAWRGRMAAVTGVCAAGLAVAGVLSAGTATAQPSAATSLAGRMRRLLQSL